MVAPLFNVPPLRASEVALGIVFAAPQVTVPALSVTVFPDPNVFAPLRIRVPEPLLVRLNAPETTELMFKVAPELATSKLPSARTTALSTPEPAPLFGP